MHTKAQQQTTNVVVVNQQPSTVPLTTVRVASRDQSSLIVAVIVSLIAFFCGCWWTLLCSIPAIVFGRMVSTVCAVEGVSYCWSTSFLTPGWVANFCMYSPLGHHYKLFDCNTRNNNFCYKQLATAIVLRILYVYNRR